MTIDCFQGTPGSGKSAVIVADLADFLLSGGWVATNFTLVPDWLDILCSTSFRYQHYKFFNLDRDIYRKSLFDRCWRIGTPDTVSTLGDLMRSTIPTGKRIREGMGRLYLDEAQLLFNSRDWTKNKGFIEFFTQHRKLGWDVFLVTHTLDMIDKQIRGLIEYETRFRNLQKVKAFGFIPLSFKPRFLAITRYAGISAGAGNIAKRRFYTLGPYKDLYDTFEVFAFDSPRVEVSSHGEFKSHNDSTILDLNKEKCTSRKLEFNTASCWPQYHQNIFR